MTAKIRNIVGLLAVAAGTHAQQRAPFTLVGHIQNFDLVPPGCNQPLCGAEMKVNGIVVTIPANTIMVMPATYLTPHDIFKGPHGRPAAGPFPQVVAGRPVSGLALNDPAPFTPIAPYEASLSGNIDGATYVAGLVTISQQSLNTTSGYIKAINNLTGEITVGPLLANPAISAVVRLNDPELLAADGSGLGFGRYGRAESADERFTSDQGNPTVRATTGYPMCIPRMNMATTDPRCPESNRLKNPDGTYSSRFTVGPVANGDGITPGAPACPSCDPTRLVPFEVGDYIAFSGTLAKDSAGMIYISAHTMVASLGIYTSPNTRPVYVALDVSLIGTGGIAFPGVPQETGPRGAGGAIPTTRLKVEGVITDPSKAVDVFAVDFLSTGTGVERSPALLSVGPMNRPPFGRWRLVRDRSNFLPPPREIRVRVAGIPPGQVSVATVANGLIPGEFSAPVAEYIFPEGTVFGQPEVPLNFENLCFLLKGTGPLTTLGRGSTAPPGPPVLVLSPWPNSGHIQPQVTCP